MAEKGIRRSIRCAKEKFPGPNVRMSTTRFIMQPPLLLMGFSAADAKEFMNVEVETGVNFGYVSANEP